MKKLSAMCLGLVLAACAPLPRAPDGISAARVPERAAAEWPRGVRYRVDPAASSLRVIVHPAGPMARLGHSHVIGGGSVDGEVVLADPFEDSALRLRIAVDKLLVDRPAWMINEGLENELDEEAVAATRQNMLSKRLLDAEAHPEILVESVALSGPRWQPDIDALITLAGTTRELTVPVALFIDEARLTAAGRFVIRQSDFDIEPFSAAGGSLRVADEVLIRFRIEANAVD